MDTLAQAHLRAIGLCSKSGPSIGLFNGCKYQMQLNYLQACYTAANYSNTRLAPEQITKLFNARNCAHLKAFWKLRSERRLQIVAILYRSGA